MYRSIGLHSATHQIPYRIPSEKQLVYGLHIAQDYFSQCIVDLHLCRCFFSDCSIRATCFLQVSSIARKIGFRLNMSIWRDSVTCCKTVLRPSSLSKRRLPAFLSNPFNNLVAFLIDNSFVVACNKDMQVLLL